MYVTDSRRRRQSTRRYRILIFAAVAAFIVFLIARQPGLIPNPFQPTPTPTPPPTAFLLEADLAYQEGRLADAITSLQSYLALQPEDGDVWAQLARIQILNSDPANALTSAQRAVEINEDSPYYNAVLAWALDWNKQDDEAADKGMLAVDLDPGLAAARAYLAEVYADLGSWSRAEEEAQEAISLDPNNADAYRAMGYALHVQGRYKESIREYEKAIELEPQLALFHYEAGLNYSALFDHKRAVEFYRQAITLNPQFADALAALGWAYYFQDDPERAIRELEQAVELAPDNREAQAHLGMALYRRQRYEDAVIPLERAAGLGAENEAYFFTLGLSYIYGEPRNCAAAIPWLQRALELNPVSQPALAGIETCNSDESQAD